MKKREMSYVYLLTLFLLFAISAAGVLAAEVHVYTKVKQQTEQNNEQRTAVAYLMNKVRHSDQNSAVGVRIIDDTSVLVLEEVIDNVTYATMIYESAGKMKELFCDTSYEFSLEDGEDLFSVQDVNFDLNSDNLLSIKITLADGREEQAAIAIRSEGTQDES